jgi:lipoprotein NlpD
LEARSSKVKGQRALSALTFLLSAFFISGCATTEYPGLPGAGPAASVKKQGAYHKVVKGQTLWRMARAYGVGVEDIIHANNIPNAAAIEVGQLIFIPGVKGAKDIPERTPDENKEEFAWPLKGKIIRYFGSAQSISRGLDIEANEGDTVKASREGKVVMLGYLTGYGQTIMVDHGDGFISVYAQNRKFLVQLGDHVYKAEAIAETGRRGRKSFCHFEIRKGGDAVNPLYYLP